MHFRKGQHGQWQEDFSNADQRLVDDLIQDRIWRGVEAAAGRHPGLAAAQGSLGSGDAKRAAAAALQAVIEFPNHRPAYELLFSAVERCGISAEPLRGQVEAELKPRNTAESFIYRYELVDACVALVSGLERSAGMTCQESQTESPPTQ